MHRELQRGTVATRRFNDRPRSPLTLLTVLYIGASGAGAALTVMWNVCIIDSAT